jgi:hypothetical protein
MVLLYTLKSKLFWLLVIFLSVQHGRRGSQIVLPE